MRPPNMHHHEDGESDDGIGSPISPSQRSTGPPALPKKLPAGAYSPLGPPPALARKLTQEPVTYNPRTSTMSSVSSERTSSIGQAPVLPPKKTSSPSITGSMDSSEKIHSDHSRGASVKQQSFIAPRPPISQEEAAPKQQSFVAPRPPSNSQEEKAPSPSPSAPLAPRIVSPVKRSPAVEAAMARSAVKKEQDSFPQATEEIKPSTPQSSIGSPVKSSIENVNPTSPIKPRVEQQPLSAQAANIPVQAVSVAPRSRVASQSPDNSAPFPQARPKTATAKAVVPDAAKTGTPRPQTAATKTASNGAEAGFKSKFCYECGFKYQTLGEKFCSDCGTKRII
jgi:hypothetical protein